ncbi:pseudouridine synthase [Spirosoma sp. SC4-14]|uniref:pseudouridine synthase n=1 Tax=Spirosoma sp. SC4-14 TaxID=3128900 RepID=UPI0030D0452D
MNQDSDQNGRRDGESRSFGRRDDGPRFNRNRNDDSRDNNGDRPRFSRNNDRPDNDRPRFNRERDANQNDRPRFSRERNDNQNDRPRFSRERNDNQNDRPRFNRDRNDNRSDNYGNRRFDRDDKPSYNRDRNNDRPRFSRDDKPNFERNERPRFERDDKPRFERNERPRFDRDDKPRFERNNDRFGNERRFNDRADDRPRSRTDRGSNRFGNESERFSENDRPRFNRNNDERPRFSRDDKPAFNRDEKKDRYADKKNRFSREGESDSEKPAFKRVGGFNREADERNRFDRTNDRRSFQERNDQDEPSRFSHEQRKQSSERRAGKYKKAPDYSRADSFTDRFDKPRKPRQYDNNEQPKRKAVDDGLMRLNRYIANSGVCSRREADELIARGDISVNGKIITEMGFKVKEGDTVKYGTKVLNPERFVYVLLNKPKDYITTTEDPEERKTVMELVADAGNFRMYPVGRLDRNTTGLLLLTNDGELADKLTHPSNDIRKIYQVEIDKPITDEHFEAIRDGLTLEDGPIKPDALSIVTPDAQVIGIEIHSGRNRIVRRIFEHLGYEVTKLDRTTYAGLTKKDLPRGKWRFLEPKEVVKLKYFNS